MKTTKKGILLALAASMAGLAQQAQTSAKIIDPRPGFSDKDVPIFYPNRGTSPKDYGLYIATSSTHKANRKIKQKKAFG